MDPCLSVWRMEGYTVGMSRMCYQIETEPISWTGSQDEVEQEAINCQRGGLMMVGERKIMVHLSRIITRPKEDALLTYDNRYAISTQSSVKGSLRT